MNRSGQLRHLLLDAVRVAHAVIICALLAVVPATSLPLTSPIVAAASEEESRPGGNETCEHEGFVASNLQARARQHFVAVSSSAPLLFRAASRSTARAYSWEIPRLSGERERLNGFGGILRC